VHIVNATAGGLLDVYERRNYIDLLGAAAHKAVGTA